MRFLNRVDAGQQLAKRLVHYRKNREAVVLGLARGGVVVASEVAQALELPLNVLVVRKIGAPGNPELALGAISEWGEGVFNTDLIAAFGVSKESLHKEIQRQKALVEERIRRYRGSVETLNLSEKVVILIDDGMATGASLRAAVALTRQSGAKEVVAAIPVAAADPFCTLQKEADEAICLLSPPSFEAVGAFYEDFSEVGDAEVARLIHPSKAV